MFPAVARVGSEGQQVVCPWGHSWGQLLTHISHGEIRAGAKLLPSGFSARVCVCVHLSVRAGAECWVSKARRAQCQHWATGTAGFWFLEQSWTEGTALCRGLCSAGAHGVSGVFIIPLSRLLLLGSLSFLSLFYFKVAFCNKRNKKNAFGWFRWR